MKVFLATGFEFVYTIIGLYFNWTYYHKKSTKAIYFLGTKY